MSRTVLVTGPVDGLARYASAARAAGWQALACPLLEIRPEPAALAGALDGAPFDWICVTSRGALPALARAAERLRAVPCAAVGARTAAELRALGFVVEVGPAPSAAALSALLAPRLLRGARVLWPRGSLAEELGQRLAELGADVHAPVVYATMALPMQAPLPAADAVFFASPSAVRRFAELDPARDFAATAALAIGATTLDAVRALEQAAGRAFATVVALSEPSPVALRTALEALSRRSP